MKTQIIIFYRSVALNVTLNFSHATPLEAIIETDELIRLLLQSNDVFWLQRRMNDGKMERVENIARQQLKLTF